MNNPKMLLYIGYTMLFCGLLITLVRIAQMLNLFGLSRTDSNFSASAVGFIFVIAGIVNIRRYKKNNQ
ncbi:MAG: hypothetical protein MUF45_04745 [Spirosomaceae bacterium]|nr:hypothetical protein [Spirosomataceae bacterium]